MKKTNLSAALQQVARDKKEVSESVEQNPSLAIPPSRRGKKTVAGHFDPAVSRQLREIALAEDSSVQELLREALNDLFVKRGRSPIA